MDTSSPTTLPSSWEVQVDIESGSKPRTVARLQDWEYLERALMRLIAGWGRYMAAWDDKVAVHRHIWEQAECVRRLRERLMQFPGSVHNLDQPVAQQLEALANTVLLAPSHPDAVDGIYQLLSGALTSAYLHYIQRAHPIHDAPTVATLHEIVSVKEQQRLWLREYRRRYPHSTDATYRAAIEQALAACDQLLQPLPRNGLAAAPAGVNTDFRLPARPAYPPSSQPPVDIMPILMANFAEDLETRRLFWPIGYMREMNLAMDQLCWIYDGHHMPWEFQQDIARHLWDESRHGDSGYSRLLDFGISITEIGFSPYSDPAATTSLPPAAPQYPLPNAIPAAGWAKPLSPADLYEVVFSIGLIAETGHFQVKREAYDDFKAGGDLESAEMMLFDIIDESAHVQYAHRWLPLLAKHAMIDHEGYRERAAAIRQQRQEEHLARLASYTASATADNDPNRILYNQLIERVRTRYPLSNATTCPPRSPLPM